jgi:Deoxyribonuclease II
VDLLLAHVFWKIDVGPLEQTSRCARAAGRQAGLHDASVRCHEKRTPGLEVGIAPSPAHATGADLEILVTGSARSALQLPWCKRLLQVMRSIAPCCLRLQETCALRVPGLNIERSSLALTTAIDFQALGMPYEWSETKDHAKMVTSMKGEGDWVCVADINRQVSQDKCGGGAICFQNPRLWAGLAAADQIVPGNVKVSRAGR